MTTTATVFATAVSTLADAIHSQVLGGRKMSTIVRELAGQYAAGELAELLTDARRETQAKLDRLVKIEAGKGLDTSSLSRAHVNAWGHATRTASDLLDVKFTWDRKSKAFKLDDKPAAGEKPVDTAAGNDDSDPKATSEAIQQNAAAAPELSKADALTAILGAGSILGDDNAQAIIQQLVKAGINIKALQDSVQFVANQLAIDSVKQAESEKAAQLANMPKSGKILAEKLVNKPAQKKRKVA